MTVGVMRGTSAEAQLQQLDFTQVHMVKDQELLAKMLALGRIDAWAGPEPVLRYLFAKTGGDTSKLQAGPVLGDVTKIYIAGDTSFPEADAKAIADGDENLPASGKLDEIVMKYQ